jgi:hypothetical protein
MVAALWSNSNFDDDKGTRKKAIADIEQNYQDALEAIELSLRPQSVIEEEDKLTDDNPFFAAAERGLQRMETKAGIRKEDKPEPMNYMKGLDQE